MLSRADGQATLSSVQQLALAAQCGQLLQGSVHCCRAPACSSCASPSLKAISTGLVQQHGLDAARLTVQLLLPGMRHPPVPSAAAQRQQFPWVLNAAVVLR